jgi:UDP-GlcNAc3NAcA epimerase
MRKILTVVGARPQFVKASVVSQALLEKSGLVETVVHTGQHFDADMSEVFFTELGMSVPEVNLGIHGGSHGEMTARMIVGVENIILREEPDVVLVYGDTNSTLAASLAAAKLNVPIAHVESGLRSFNRRMPEETNRVVTDHLSTWLFAPTDEAVRNLNREGLSSAQIHQVGDVMYDVALRFGKTSPRKSPEILGDLGLSRGGYILATLHREGNTDNAERLRSIVGGLLEVSDSIPVVFPVHPRAKRALIAHGLFDELEKRVRLLEPVGYLDMIALERSAAVIATDSGGVQKEAFFHLVPCVTMREETEWIELVELGWNRLVPPTSSEAIASAVLGAVDRPGRPGTPYGNGTAAASIVSVLARELLGHS